MSSVLNRLAMKSIGKLESVQPVIPARYGACAVDTEEDIRADSASGPEPLKEIAHERIRNAGLETTASQNQQAPKFRIALSNIGLHGACMESNRGAGPARRVSLDEFLEREREARV